MVNSASNNTRHDKLVLWPIVGYDDLGIPSVETFESLDVRIEHYNRDTMRARSNTINEPIEINVTKDVDIGSYVFLGSLGDLDLFDTAVNQVYKVVNFEKIRSVRGNKYDRWITVTHNGEVLPPYAYILCHDNHPLYHDGHELVHGFSTDYTDVLTADTETAQTILEGEVVTLPPETAPVSEGTWTNQYYEEYFSSNSSGGYGMFGSNSNVIALEQDGLWTLAELDDTRTLLDAESHPLNGSTMGFFMWADADNEYWWLNGSDLELRDFSGNILSTFDLGTDRDGNTVQWRAGTGAGGTKQYIVGYYAADNAEYIQFFDRDGIQEGWWTETASASVGRTEKRWHNKFNRDGYGIAGQWAGADQDIMRTVDYDGTVNTYNPDTNVYPISHPSWKSLESLFYTSVNDEIRYRDDSVTPNREVAISQTEQREQLELSASTFVAGGHTDIRGRGAALSVQNYDDKTWIVAYWDRERLHKLDDQIVRIGTAFNTALLPGISPDNRWIAYQVDGGVKILEVPSELLEDPVIPVGTEAKPDNALQHFEGVGGLTELLDAAILPHRSSLYNTYGFLALHSLYKATGNTYYWDVFKQLMDKWMTLATDLAVDTTTGSQWPVNVGSPWIGYGAEQTVYKQYEWGTVRPSAKHLRHLGMFAGYFLLDVLDGTAGLPASEVTAARGYYDFLRLVVFERMFTSYGIINRNVDMMVDSAVTQTVGNNGNLNGYWGSQVTLAISALMMDEALRQAAGYAPYKYQSGVSDNPLVVFNDLDYMKFYNLWKAATHLQTDGSLLWDVDSASPINVAGLGWGLTNDHKAPSTGHTNRHANMVRLAYQLGHETDLSFVEALATTFGKRINLGLNYRTTQGTHNGVIAGVQQFANYIDGDNTSFRINYGGIGRYLTPNGSNEGMNGFCYHGWGQLGGVHNAAARTAIHLLTDEIFQNPSRSASDPKLTGTYERYRGVHGKVGLLGIVAEIESKGA